MFSKKHQNLEDYSKRGNGALEAQVSTTGKIRIIEKKNLLKEKNKQMGVPSPPAHRGALPLPVIDQTHVSPRNEATFNRGCVLPGARLKGKRQFCKGNMEKREEGYPKGKKRSLWRAPSATGIAPKPLEIPRAMR